ncbi:MAG: WG repeat-containing protein, partial [Raineya sp.]|nr:WG repeat-containing protein [Raineya sp.]
EAKQFGEMGLDSSLAFAKQNNLWGVIDQKGKWTLEPKYDTVYNKNINYQFETKQDVVKIIIVRNNVNKKNMVIDNQGIILNIIFQEAFKVYPNYIFFINEGLETLCLLDKKQNIKKILLHNYDNIQQYSMNSFFVEKNGRKSIYIPQKEEFLVEDFDEMYLLRKDIWIIQRGKKYTTVNIEATSKKYLGEFDRLYSLDLLHKQEFCVLKDNKMGLIDTSGNIIIPIEYEQVKKYTSTKYIIEQNGKFGLFDLEMQKKILDVKYKKIEDKRMVENIYFLPSGDFCLVDIGEKKMIYDIKKSRFLPNIENCFEEYLNDDVGVAIIEYKNKYALFKGLLSSGYKNNTNAPYQISKYYDEIIIEPYNGIFGYNGLNKYRVSMSDFSEKKVKYTEPLPSKVVSLETNQNNSRLYSSIEVFEDAQFEGGIENYKHLVLENISNDTEVKKGLVILELVIDQDGKVRLLQTLKGTGWWIMQGIEKLNDLGKIWKPARLTPKGNYIGIRKEISFMIK